MANLRFFIPTLLLVATIATFIVGGYWLWTGLLLVTVVPRVMDFILGDLKETPVDGAGLPWHLAQLLTIPLLASLMLLLLYYLGEARMGWLEKPTGWLGADLAVAKAKTNLTALFGGVLTVGIWQGSTGVIVGHELIHCSNRPLLRMLGNWLLAPTCFPAFSLEHVRRHHVDVAIPGDPETAPRGQSFWAFMVADYLATNRDAVTAETQRLKRSGSGWYSPGNRALRGYALSLLVGLIFVLAAGWAGLAAFLVIAFLGTLCTTLFSYIAHYGLVRLPGTPIEARHSWNSYRFWSTSVMFNLTRHANHHLRGNRPYWRLELETSGPVYPYGPTVMAGLALVPPLWRRVMTEPLQDWDQRMASPGELELLGGLN